MVVWRKEWRKERGTLKVEKVTFNFLCLLQREGGGGGRTLCARCAPSCNHAETGKKEAFWGFFLATSLRGYHVRAAAKPGEMKETTYLSCAKWAAAAVQDTRVAGRKRFIPRMQRLRSSPHMREIAFR